MKRTQSKSILKGALWALLAVAVLAAFFVALKNVREEIGRQGVTKLEDAVRRAAVACFAAEGAYPPDIDYLIEHYGIRVDEDRYIIHYDIFAQNLIPDITVLEKGNE